MEDAAPVAQKHSLQHDARKQALHIQTHPTRMIKQGHMVGSRLVVAQHGINAPVRAVHIFFAGKTPGSAAVHDKAFGCIERPGIVRNGQAVRPAHADKDLRGTFAAQKLPQKTVRGKRRQVTGKGDHQRAQRHQQRLSRHRSYRG